MIRLENLTKEYDEVIAVRDVSIEIPEGEIYGLIGPNGAGKTTMLRMCCGLLPATSGRVLVNGIEVQNDLEAAQSQIGYLADFFSVYDDLKVWEYLDYFARAYKLDSTLVPERVNEVIAEIGLEVKRDSMVKGLSRGMKQRLGIGRAVIHRPKVLLLDEPASGLDPESTLRIAPASEAAARSGRDHRRLLAHPSRPGRFQHLDRRDGARCDAAQRQGRRAASGGRARQRPHHPDSLGRACQSGRRASARARAAATRRSAGARGRVPVPR